jgi:hypothetical protein
MLAVVERVRLGGALLLLGGAGLLFAIETRDQRVADERPTHGYHCAHHFTTDEAGAVADRLYHLKRFEDAECVLRVAADREEPAKQELLHVVASFYHQLGHSYPLALDRSAPDSLDQLEWAIQFDTMLGGAFHEQLIAERAERYVMIRK